jgi:hypothetical protein
MKLCAGCSQEFNLTKSPNGRFRKFCCHKCYLRFWQNNRKIKDPDGYRGQLDGKKSVTKRSKNNNQAL